jgi:hypothetical protein
MSGCYVAYLEHPFDVMDLHMLGQTNPFEGSESAQEGHVG